MRTILPKISNSQPPSPEREIQPEPFLRTQQVTMITQREKTPVYEPAPKQAPTPIPQPIKTAPEPKIPEPVKSNDNAIIPEKKVFRYSPPSINLSTWSERPKSQVALKSDSDYTIGDANKPRVELNQFQQRALQKPEERSDTNGGYYRFQNIKRMPRPHSIAFESYQDLSHVPIVRSVELKKPIREEPEAMGTQTLNRNTKPFYKSTEQINQSQTLDRNNEYNSVLRNIQRFSANDTGVKVSRGNSFGFNSGRNSLNLNPVVKGFRSSEDTNPVKGFKSSEDTCRVTVNGVSQTFGKSEVAAAPPPPMPPPVLLKPVSNKRVTKVNKVNKVVEDPRDELLDAIRSFGKNNLKPVRY